ncbi:MAG: dipeptidase [Herpetosiphon sp.]
MAVWATYLDQHVDRFQGELQDFLRIPSISAQPDRASDVLHAAEWVRQRIAAAGLEHVQLLTGDGPPVVYADWLHAPGKPTVLIYGHYDVQPVDPLHLWTDPPFEPTIRDDRIYARGATDDKGNMLTPVLALEALLKSEHALPVNVKCFFEGEEEVGSPHLEQLVQSNRAMLACDLVISADGGQYGADQGQVLIGLKGLCALEITVTAARRDLHSGKYGGGVQNPIVALAHIITSLRAADGTITVDGFYDAVRPLSAQERTALAATPFDDAAFLRETGSPSIQGEPSYTPLERMGARPTLELNGIDGGYAGPGVKTIIPSRAQAKISCRLVPDQQPDRILQLVAEHIHRHTPPGVTVTTTPETARAEPYLMPLDHWGNRAVTDVLTELYGKPPYTVRTGGTIPACTIFRHHLGAYTVNFSWALDDEQAHAPNEFYRLASFRRGSHAYGRLLHRIATETHS